jgi:hypothetical protein
VQVSPLDKMKLTVLFEYYLTSLIVRLVRFTRSFTVRLASSYTYGARTTPTTSFTHYSGTIILLVVKDFSKIYFTFSATCKAADADIFVAYT